MEPRRVEETIDRLRRVEGQVQGIERMGREGRYCVDILTQLAAVRGALKEVERIVLRAYLRASVARVVRSETAERRAQQVDEIVSALRRVER